MQLSEYIDHIMSEIGNNDVLVSFDLTLNSVGLVDDGTDNHISFAIDAIHYRAKYLDDQRDPAQVEHILNDVRYLASQIAELGL